MVRCCQCSSWIHADCIAEKEEYVPGVWSCFRCRLMPLHICQMQTDLSNLMTLVQTLSTSVTSLRDDHQKLSKQLEDREETCNRLLKENSDLHAQIGALFQQSSAAQWSGFTKPQGTVLLGSSIIRDIDEGKLVNTKCVCIPGGCISDLKSKVTTFPTSHKLCRLVLVVGGNDCDSRSDERSIPDILSEFKSLMKAAQETSVSVAVSSVCPRIKPGAVMERISALNAGLKVLCDDLEVEFIDNDPTFHLQDGSINDRYMLPDGVHLTKAATNKLVTNLKLQLRHGETSAHADHRRRQPTQAHQHNAASELQMNPSHDTQSRRRAFSKPAFYNPKRQDNYRRFQAPPPRQPQVPFPSNAGHSTPAPFPSGSGHSMHKRPSNQWRAPSFEHRPTTNRGNAHERRETQPLNNTNRPKPLMTIETRPPLQPLQTRDTAATTLRQNTQQQCQLCLGFDHTAVTCRSKEQTCYNCHQVGHLSRACSVV